jgi:hypothetical protein
MGVAVRSGPGERLRRPRLHFAGRERTRRGRTPEKTLLWFAPQISVVMNYVGELLQFLSRGQRYAPGFCVGVDQV